MAMPKLKPQSKLLNELSINHSTLCGQDAISCEGTGPAAHSYIASYMVYWSYQGIVFGN